jgi:exopolyphosphatase/guanosine-5'-triphosphate,3'-diphosphate pyrophosphatase
VSTGPDVSTIAVVDIGSNSTRLLVAELDSSGRVTAELDRRTTVTRLGAGVDADGRLQDDAIERVYATLDSYHQAIEAASADRAVAVLTSAVRDASNGGAFADSVRARAARVDRRGGGPADVPRRHQRARSR